MKRKQMIMKWLMIACITGFSGIALAEKVTYPNIDGIGSESIGYSVLKLALEKSEPDIEVYLDKQEVNQTRAKYMVEIGKADVFDSGFQPELEARFKPIYLPIDRGILGWRLFIIHQDNADALGKVQSIKDLKNYLFGQGSGWGDIDILEKAGLKVITSSKISNLMGMVAGKRFEIFPLGSNEVYAFLDKFGANYPQLVIDEHISLIYPFGRFFYVNKDNEELANKIQTGLEKALDDGSLQNLLNQHAYFKDAFSKAHLHNRVQIRIDTPNLTSGFSNIPAKWWYTP